MYLYSESKEVVDEHQFGRCDRENNCGYHRHPNEDPELAARKQEDFTPVPEPIIVQKFVDEKTFGPIINRTKTCISPLHVFLNKTLLISNEHLLKWGVYSDQEDLTVYVFRNFNNAIVNLKWFRYQGDGHRDKNFESYSLRQPKSPPHPPQESDQKKLGVSESSPAPEIFKYQMCLYGEHLLPRDKDNVPVCVVESEKTAAIASFFYTQFHWVACGSNNGLTDGKDGKPDKISVLKGRTVYWLCDADQASRMKVEEKDGKKSIKPSSIRHLLENIEDFHIVDLFPDRNDGYDIGDAIVDGLRPEIKPTWSKGKNDNPLQKKQKVENDDAWEYDLPQGLDFETVKWDIRKYMHFEYKGKIYIVRKRKGKDDESSGGGTYYCQDITNFTIKSLGLIASQLEPSRLVEIKNIHGLTEVVQVPTKAFASPTEFTCFVESVGNFQYNGVGMDLKKIRAKLYDTMLTYDEIETLGWHHTGYFIFANGAYNGKFAAIDKYGFVKLGQKNFFIPPLSCIHREEQDEDQFLDEKKFVFKERKDVSLKQWSELFCKVHKDNGRIALAWYITSLFRDFIYQKFKFFPHTFLFGPPGTGKSQVGWSVRAMGFNGPVKPFNLNTGTAVAFHREFAMFRNFPAWCDEYDNSIPYERIQALKAAYDGVGHKKSVKDSDKRTKATQVNRAIMISGQQLPIADNALFKRVILLQFNQTEYSEQEKKDYEDLLVMEEHGLTHITAGFVHFRKLMEEEYMKEFDIVIREMMKEIEVMDFDVEDRIVRNSCIVLTTIKLLQSKIGDKLPYTYQDLKKVMLANIKHQMSLISNSNETNTFWDMVEFLVREQKIKEGEDFTFDSKKIVKVVVNRKDEDKELHKTTDLIYLRFSKIIPLYRENFRRQNSSSSSPMDKGSLMHYLTNSKAFVGLVARVDFKDARTSGYCFNYEILQQMGLNLGGNERNGEAPPAAVPKGTAQDGINFSGQAQNPAVQSEDMPF